MEENRPSRTARRVAMYRAAHQILDDPKIFDDPLAIRMSGLENASAQDQNQMWLEETPLSRVLRASLAARSRYAEDQLHAAIKLALTNMLFWVQVSTLLPTEIPIPRVFCTFSKWTIRQPRFGNAHVLRNQASQFRKHSLFHRWTSRPSALRMLYGEQDSIPADALSFHGLG